MLIKVSQLVALPRYTGGKVCDAILDTDEIAWAVPDSEPGYPPLCRVKLKGRDAPELRILLTVDQLMASR